MAPTVIFDLMDTVVRDPFRIIPRHLGMSFEELMRIKNPKSWPEFELGLIDEAAFFDRFFLPDCGQRLVDGAAMKAAMYAEYRYIDGMEDLLKDLRTAGVALWVHSNYTVWVDDVRAMLGLDRYFAGYAMSYRLKARKPDPDAYSRALAHIGCDPGQGIFVDDRRTNVAAAVAAGLRGIHFQGAAELRRALNAVGL